MTDDIRSKSGRNNFIQVQDTCDPPDRKTNERKSNTMDVLTFVFCLISAVLLGFATPQLVAGEGLMFFLKCLVLVLGAATASWGAVHFAIKRGAPLLAKGYPVAGVTAAASILIVGIGIWSATYSGFTRNDVEQLRLEQHSGEVSNIVNDIRSSVSSRVEAGTVVDAIKLDFGQKFLCEISNACISGRGAGEGPTSREIGSLFAQADIISTQVSESRVVLHEQAEKLSKALSSFQAQINSQDMNIDERRRALQTAQGDLNEALSDIQAILPVGLLYSFADTLNAGASIPGKIEASDRLTRVMRSHGSSLNEVLDGLPQTERVLPNLPSKTGVSDTFAYIGHFLPIAAVTAAIDLIVPISLWIYTVAFLDWDIYRRNGKSVVRPSEDDETFDVLLNRPRLPQKQSDKNHQSNGQKNHHPKRPNGAWRDQSSDQPKVDKWPGA